MSFCVHAGYTNLFKHHLVLVKSSPTRYWFKCSHEGCTMGRVEWKTKYWKGQRYEATRQPRWWRTFGLKQMTSPMAYPWWDRGSTLQT